MCGLRVSASFNDFQRTCCGDRPQFSDLIRATRENNGVGSRPGDSGGPVFALGGDSPTIGNIHQWINQRGQVIAKGTITGGTVRRNAQGEITGFGPEVWFQDFHTAYRDLGIVPMTAMNMISARNSRCVDADLNTISRNPNRAQLWDCNRQRSSRSHGTHSMTALSGT